MNKILDLLKKLFGKKELAGPAVEIIVEPKEVTHKKKPKKKKKNESR